MGKRPNVPLTTFLKRQLNTGRLPDINDILPRGQYLFDVEDPVHRDPRLIAMDRAYEAWFDSVELPPIKKGSELRPVLADVGRPGIRSLSTRSLLAGDSIAYLHFDTPGFKLFWERVKELEDLID